jgi:hypothetical protein
MRSSIGPCGLVSQRSRASAASSASAWMEKSIARKGHGQRMPAVY